MSRTQKLYKLMVFVMMGGLVMASISVDLAQAHRSTSVASATQAVD